MNEMINFFKNKKVLITGHTGFKGAWLLKILDMFGAKCYGISHMYYEENIYSKLEINNLIDSQIFDISDYDKTNDYINKIKPDIIFHLAAQPLVVESYKNPYITYKTNVMGTLNICESIKNSDYKISFVCITTDKVYKNNEVLHKYKENEELNGFDPYSNSKSCADMLTQCYINSIFNKNIACSICRSGNVIGGGDTAKDRIVPDLYRSIDSKVPLKIRSKDSIRPYQHVLEANFAYLLIAQYQFENKNHASIYNIAPDDESIITTDTLVKKFQAVNEKVIINYDSNNNVFHEAKLLLLDNTYIKEKIKWCPILDIDECIQYTNEWYLSANKNIITENQIKNYMNKWGKKHGK